MKTNQINMKKVQLFNTMEGFEKFINRTDIEVIQVDVKVVEQSMMFQQNFAAVVFYKGNKMKQIKIKLPF